MTIQQFRYFAKIVDCGSMSEAASKLHISQPSLSIAIRELENEIGKMLFQRSKKGITITQDGMEFLGYVRQVLQQMNLIEGRYIQGTATRQKFSVSSHHYLFIANAFVDFINQFDGDEYTFALRETTTWGIIEDVKNLRSEIGIMYMSNFNRQVISKVLKENYLKFDPLFSKKPRIFLYRQHPLAKREKVTLDDLQEYPKVQYDQGIHNSFYFSEEILSNINTKKSIIVTDRHAVVNMLVGLNAYTIGTGIYPSSLHGRAITSVPLDVDEIIEIGIVTLADYVPSPLGKLYLDSLKKLAASLCHDFPNTTATEETTLS